MVGGYSDLLLDGRSGDRNPAEARFSAPVQIGPGAHSTSSTMNSGFLLPPPPSAEVKGKVELSFYSPAGPSQKIIG